MDVYNKERAVWRKREPNEDLEFIQNIIKEEIKTWTGYKKEVVDEYKEEEFIKETSIEVVEYLETSGYPLEKDIILDYLNLIVENNSFLL